MKNLFVSFLAILPAVNVVETTLFNSQHGARLPTRTKTVSDLTQSWGCAGTDDAPDASLHHRYYGQSACL